MNFRESSTKCCLNEVETQASGLECCTNMCNVPTASIFVESLEGCIQKESICFINLVFYTNKQSVSFHAPYVDVHMG